MGPFTLQQKGFQQPCTDVAQGESFAASVSKMALAKFKDAERHL